MFKFYGPLHGHIKIVRVYQPKLTFDFFFKTVDENSYWNFTRNFFPVGLVSQRTLYNTQLLLHPVSQLPIATPNFLVHENEIDWATDIWVHASYWWVPLGQPIESRTRHHPPSLVLPNCQFHFFLLLQIVVREVTFSSKDPSIRIWSSKHGQFHSPHSPHVLSIFSWPGFFSISITFWLFIDNLVGSNVPSWIK